ncbi:uncharacterized protein SPSK_09956 [Sporothrix schenckii 1099-18]|uniref:Secreted protein n=1 Tax=Sporothrix schenckii 1099-18 TaxID=1397361 RepID=A0A0F2M6M9_SPOSC|nr:uncharacterized protein SPSK_09956 [Sporothrix schenckii 1099-18]KJR85277.1 hypothetical protein SPSK_09956 [Sporothrix schenckii 1099-18]
MAPLRLRFLAVKLTVSLLQVVLRIVPEPPGSYFSPHSGARLEQPRKKDSRRQAHGIGTDTTGHDLCRPPIVSFFVCTSSVVPRWFCIYDASVAERTAGDERGGCVDEENENMDGDTTKGNGRNADRPAVC